MSDSFPANPKIRVPYATPHDFILWHGVFVEWEGDSNADPPTGMQIKRILTAQQYQEAVAEYYERQQLRWLLAKYPDEWPESAG